MPRLNPSPIPFAGCFTKTRDFAESGKLVFSGLPSDKQSTFRSGARHAPDKIRKAYDGHCFHATTETGVDLYRFVTDLGDVEKKSDWAQTFDAYREWAKKLFLAKKVPFFAGGDHAVTIPVVEALAALKIPIHFIQFDAHPDLYPDYNGKIHSHACVAARILEMSHVDSVTQLGIRAMNAQQQQVADHHGDRLRIFNARTIQQSLPSLAYLPDNAHVYLSIDLDCFDPGCAPGVSHPVHGGLNSRQVINFIQDMRWNLVGMDVVELNPEVDEHDRTAILAAKVMHEAMGYVAKADI